MEIKMNPDAARTELIKEGLESYPKAKQAIQAFEQ
jgi:hypothetical protein